MADPWIAIDDELPYLLEMPIMLWVSDKKDGTPRGCYAGFYSHCVYDGVLGAWFELDGTRVFGVTHWMPYPSGPNGDDWTWAGQD
jgi:hypothetical protein